MKRSVKIYLSTFVFFISIGVVHLLGIHTSIQYEKKLMYWITKDASYSKKESLFQVEKGSSVYKVLHDLKKNHFIRSYFPYIYAYRSVSVKAGEYLLSSSSTPSEILEKIIAGDVFYHSITFPEGINTFQIADIFQKKEFFSKKEFLKAIENKKLIYSLLNEHLDSIEGYLFPNTYKLTKGVSPKQVIQMMVNEFLEHYKKLDHPYKLSRHQVVTLASVIEKETGVPQERAQISSVFFNRLQKQPPMRLQSDPTTIYGMWKKTGIMPTNIRRRDLREKTPYNTYRVEGLPKGPIANPGYESLRAVFHPALTPYFFFVSRNDGTHIFSIHYSDHKKYVDYYQKKLRPKK